MAALLAPGGVSPPATRTWRDLLAEAADRLGSPHEARRLVERASGFDGTDYALGLAEPVPARAVPFFEGMLDRRAAGEPLQYVLGSWGFRRLDLFVDRRVLIPRPETEMVVQVALAELATLRVKRPTVVDLGTGSGAIGLSVAVEVPSARVVATDRSADALEVAALNLTGIGTLAAGRVELRQGSWFEALDPALRGGVHLLVSNPPYVGDAELLPDEVAGWEPHGALRAGPTGLEDVEHLVREAPAWLARPGVLVVELAPHQAGAAIALARDAGFTSAEARLDLSGRERMLLARLAP
ncbi:MAG TPA: peptide chain release factor N(5)-glutamine methyltransferase [Acidimicrobiales bacterium]|nr:peptide chain release factor N(5)-glutamine methyltransferase [Acidimicrobiales bacterium]